MASSNPPAIPEQVLPSLSCTDSTSTTTEMPSYNGNHSSQEISASAFESERKAKERQHHAVQLEAQINALRAQQKAAEEESQRYIKQAEEGKQAARKQSFIETLQVKQADFRNSIAEEVYTRIASTLKSSQDHQYLKAIAEHSPGFENPTDLKLMLWDAVAGNDPEFLRHAAQSVHNRCKNKISDEDVAQIKASVACFGAHSNTQLLIPTPETTVAVTSDLREIPGTDKISTHARQTESTVFLVDGTVQGQTSSETIESPTETESHVDQVDRRLRAIGRPVKREPTVTREDLPLFVRRTMSEIDDSPPFHSVHDGSSASTIETLSSSALFDQDNLVAPSSQSESLTPVVSKKRARKDDNFVDSQSAQTATPKRLRTAKITSPTVPRLKDFVQTIERQAGDDNLHESNFHCSHCGKDIKKDAKFTACSHLFHESCLKKMRKTAGRGAFRCSHVGCGKDIGRSSAITFELLQHLKQKYLATSEEESDGEDEPPASDAENQVEQDNADGKNDEDLI